MDCYDRLEDANPPDFDFPLPCAVTDRESPPEASSSSPIMCACAPGGDAPRSPEEIEVLASGCISRAPLPVSQAKRLESVAGVEEGTYFVELMRRRLQCICDMQSKWMSRTCNKKRLKYVDTQASLKEFAEETLRKFELRFGPPSADMRAAPTRKHAAPRKTPRRAL